MDNRWVALQGAEAVPESEWIQVAPGPVPFWSPDSRTLYYARFQEGSADA